MTVEDVARILYMTIRAYCATVVNWERRGWEKLFDYEREEAINEAKFFLEDPNRSVELYHNAWLKRMIMDGWSYDKEFDMATKKHHYIKPFKEMPLEHQFKDHIFKTAIDILINMGIELKEGEEEDDE